MWLVNRAVNPVPSNVLCHQLFFVTLEISYERVPRSRKPQPVAAKEDVKCRALVRPLANGLLKQEIDVPRLPTLMLQNPPRFAYFGKVYNLANDI